MEKPQWYWHIHHDVLLETSSNIAERIEYIKDNKSKGEIETRLHLLKPVRGQLPKPYLRAEDAYDKAEGTWDKVRKAWKACNKAREKYRPQIEALHAKECPDCPWNGETIFPT